MTGALTVDVDSPSCLLEALVLVVFTRASTRGHRETPDGRGSETTMLSRLRPSPATRASNCYETGERRTTDLALVGRTPRGLHGLARSRSATSGACSITVTRTLLDEPGGQSPPSHAAPGDHYVHRRPRHASSGLRAHRCAPDPEDVTSPPRVSGSPVATPPTRGTAAMAHRSPREVDQPMAARRGRSVSLDERPPASGSTQWSERCPHQAAEQLGRSPCGRRDGSRRRPLVDVRLVRLLDPCGPTCSTPDSSRATRRREDVRVCRRLVTSGEPVAVLDARGDDGCRPVEADADYPIDVEVVQPGEPPRVLVDDLSRACPRSVTPRPLASDRSQADDDDSHPTTLRRADDRQGSTSGSLRISLPV